MRRKRNVVWLLLWVVTLVEVLSGRAMEIGDSDPAAGDILDEDNVPTSGEDTLISQPLAGEQSAGSPYVHPKPDDTQVGCQELTSKRYISDGFCTSVKPVTERVCGGFCLPIGVLPWYAEYVKVWARTKSEEWRCVEDRIRRRWVTLLCENGETRRYPIRVVVSCRCKRFAQSQNRSHTSTNQRQRSSDASDAARFGGSRTERVGGRRPPRNRTETTTSTNSFSATRRTGSALPVPEQ